MNIFIRHQAVTSSHPPIIGTSSLPNFSAAAFDVVVCGTPMCIPWTLSRQINFYWARQCVGQSLAEIPGAASRGPDAPYQ